MTTAEELRETIVKTVLANGGHLASSLGAVELALALAEVFDPAKDRVVWDVGHQAYAWKLLTGRAERFGSLRKLDGLAPFPLPGESVADAAVAGHAGSALSVALGLAAARDCCGTDEQVVAVVGDASLSNGHSLEALVRLASATRKLIVVLNDNEGKCVCPVGALAKLCDVSCVGPVDGHDVDRLKAALQEARDGVRSVLVHVVTRKGRGYAPAEEDPARYHNVSVSAEPGVKTWSDAFGEALRAAAREDVRVFALTAGMADGTGLAGFAREFPRRFRDVGIAEGHMVAFAAGLAAGGLRPVVAVYSTFLQRAVDQVMHDVCIANLPVVFCVDRAGVVGPDGVTHQGLYDIAMLRTLPNLTICQPKDADDLKALLDEALKRNGPTVIRYPRGAARSLVSLVSDPAGEAQLETIDVRRKTRSRLAIWATGDQLEKAHAVAAAFPGSEVVFARYLKPFDAALLNRQREAGRLIVSIENGAVAGGFGEAIGADLRFGWPDAFIPHGAIPELERRFHFDADSIVSTINRTIRTIEQPNNSSYG